MPKSTYARIDTIHDPAAPMRCRVDSAKIIVNLAGYVAGAPAATTFDKELEAIDRRIGKADR